MAPRSVKQSVFEATPPYIETLSGIAKENAKILSQSSNTVATALSALATAYQDMFNGNVEAFTKSVEALSSAKTPAEFNDIQQKLLREAFERFSANAEVIAELTSTVFTAACVPIQQQVAAAPDIMKTVAKLPWSGPTLVM